MIRYYNSYYKIHITADGIVSILNANDNVLSVMSYQASYGKTANPKQLLIGANINTVDVWDASGFETNDEILFVSNLINETILHTATITGVSNIEASRDRITFTPVKTSNIISPSHNNQLSPAFYIKKIINTITSYSDSVISEQIIEGGKNIILDCETDIAYLNFTFVCLDNSHKIKCIITTTYKSDVIIFNEKLLWTFAESISEIYTKNRKLINSDFDTEYWVGNQGAAFGTEDKKLLSYNNYKCSSVEVNTSTKIMTFNLDDDRDHHYRKLYVCGDDADYDNGIMNFQNTSQYLTDQSKENEINFYRIDGVISPIMINPNLYLSTFCLDSHADGSLRKTQKALFYGHEDHVIGESTSKGFVGHNIPFTHGVWRSFMFDAGQTYCKDICDDIYSKGFEIKLHCIPLNQSYSQETKILIKTDISQFMSENYASKSWSDHSYKNTPECLTVFGLDEADDSYMKELWDLYNVKYFSSQFSEDISPSIIDVLSGRINHRRSPLYWKHQTRIGEDYIISAQHFKDPINVLNESNIEMLIANYGLYVSHCYVTYENVSFVGSVETVGGKSAITDSFNSYLGFLAEKRNDNELNVTTLSNIMGYWEQLENIEVVPIQEWMLNIINNNAISIEGLSLNLPFAEKVISGGIILNSKKVNNDLIFSLTIDGNEEKEIVAIANLNENENDYIAKQKINSTLKTLAYLAGESIVEIDTSLVGADLINALNDNISNINSSGIAVGVSELTIGMKGSVFENIINKFFEEYLIANM
jgi:hypothetical protein